MRVYDTEWRLLPQVSIPLRKHNEQHRRLSASQRRATMQATKFRIVSILGLRARSRDSSSTAQYRYTVPRTEPKRS